MVKFCSDTDFFFVLFLVIAHCLNTTELSYLALEHLKYILVLM